MKPKTLKKKRLAFLEDTVNHYNSNNRCELRGSCKYSPYTLGIENTSQGCAIGRYLSKRLAKKFDKLSVVVSNPDVYEELPNKLKILGIHFLEDVQYLHDFRDNWDELGLTEDGLMRVEYLKKKYELV